MIALFSMKLLERLRNFFLVQRSRLGPRGAPPGIYEIRAVLPEEDGQRQYRIKSLIEPHERVVSEHELSDG